MLPVHPEIVSPEAVPAEGVLAAVGFGVALQHGAPIPIRQFGEPRVELWRSPLPVTYGHCGEVSFASNGEVIFGTVSGAGSDTETLTARLYARIVETARRAGTPHLLRVWNHVGGINECERELERYRRFSLGRHTALARFGYGREQFPAACAVGMRGEGLIINFLASRVRGVQIENPRQISAYDYPARYGPRSPSFSRVTVARWDGETMIFISGTSSVVGHETLHAGDAEAQLDETLRNLEAIIGAATARATLDDLCFAKTYIRCESDYALVARRVTAALPRAQHLFLQADICRGDLLVEIEGVARI